MAPVVAIINTSPDTVEMLTAWLEYSGLVVVSGYTHEIRAGELDLESFLRQHRPAVVVYDIAPPYERNWRFFEHLRDTVLHGYPCVITSTNAGLVKKLLNVESPVYEILEKPTSLDAILDAIRHAAGLTHPSEGPGVH